MRFISGLKNLSKKSILLFIVILFIISWILFIFAIVSNIAFSIMMLYFLGALAGFTFLLLIFSIIIPIDKMGIATIIISAVLTLPIMLIFSGIIKLFYLFCFFANQFITAFFAYKFSMDTSTGIDNYLYKKKGSRIFTRILEFILFLLLYLWLLSIVVRFFSSSSAPGIANLFVFFLWINLILIGLVLLRLIFTKKLAAYIPIFYVLTFFYVLYLVLDFLAYFIFFGSYSYSIFSFFIVLLLFLYIIGSIFDRVDYIKKKIKLFRAGTIALFVILMKLVVQVNNILQLFLQPLVIALQLIYQLQVLLYFFMIFTLFVGLYTIFAHKEGKKS